MSPGLSLSPFTPNSYIQCLPDTSPECLIDNSSDLTHPKLSCWSFIQNVVFLSQFKATYAASGEKDNSHSGPLTHILHKICNLYL